MGLTERAAMVSGLWRLTTRELGLAHGLFESLELPPADLDAHPRARSGSLRQLLDTIDGDTGARPDAGRQWGMGWLLAGAFLGSVHATHGTETAPALLDELETATVAPTSGERSAALARALLRMGAEARALQEQDLPTITAKSSLARQSFERAVVDRFGRDGVPTPGPISPSAAAPDCDPRCAVARLRSAGGRTLALFDSLGAEALTVQTSDAGPMVAKWRGPPLGRGRLAVAADDASGRRRVVAHRDLESASDGQTLLELGWDPSWRRAIVMVRGLTPTGSLRFSARSATRGPDRD